MMCAFRGLASFADGISPEWNRLRHILIFYTSRQQEESVSSLGAAVIIAAVIRT